MPWVRRSLCPIGPRAALAGMACELQSRTCAKPRVCGRGCFQDGPLGWFLLQTFASGVGGVRSAGSVGTFSSNKRLALIGKTREWLLGPFTFSRRPKPSLAIVHFMKNPSVGSNQRFQSWTPFVRQLGAVGAFFVAAAGALAQSVAVGTLAGTVGTSAPFSNVASVTFNNPYGVAADGSGNAYIADTSNHVIRKISAAGVVSTLVGSPGSAGFINDATAGAAAARFSAPRGIAINGAGTTLYVADTANNAIRVVALSGLGGTVTGVTTLAGTGATGTVNSGATSTFTGPRGVVINGAGDTLFVADTFSQVVRSIVIAGPVVSTVAGLLGNPGTANGDSATATFNTPWGIAVNAAGTAVYVADYENHAIRRIVLTPTVAVTTYAGTIGTAGFTNNTTGTSATFRNPTGLAVDGSDNLYVGEFGNNAIRLVAAATGNAVSTVAGGTAGSADGTSTAAQFTGPTGVAVRTISSTLFLFVADTNNQLIRKGAPPSAASVGSPGNVSAAVGANVSFTAAVTGGWPTPTLLWFRQAGGTGSFVAITASSTYVGVTTQTLTVNGLTLAMQGDRFKLVATNGSGAPESSVATLTVNLAPTYTLPTATFTAVVGQLATFSAAVASGSAPITYAVTTGSLAPFSLNTTTGAITGTPSSTADSVTATITASNGTLPNATLTVTINVVLTSVPVINTQPQSSNVAAGQTSTSFTVAAVGTPSALTYQWQRQLLGAGAFTAITNGTVGSTTFSGATTTTLSLTGVTPSMSTDVFRVVVTNTTGTTTSANATLTVLGTVPVISTAPSAQAVDLGANATFTGAATGNPAPTLRWQVQYNGAGSFVDLTEGSPYSGTATGTLAITGVVAAENGDRFQLVASNAHGVATSTPVALTVNSAVPAIVTNPQNVSVNVTTNATFTASAIGNPTPTLRWQRQPNGITTGFTDLTDNSTYGGTSTGTLTVTAVTVGMNQDQFKMVATNTNGSVTSTTVVLTVTSTPPTITTNPSAATVNLGVTATFTGAASGSPTPTLRWQRQPSGTTGGFIDLSDDGTYSGTATGTLTIVNPTAGMTGDQFKLVATNVGGSTASTFATLTVNAGTSITTFAGTAGLSGSTDATGVNARFSTPAGIAADPQGNFYVADAANNIIRKITSGGVVSTLAGLAGSSGNVDGTGSAARFNAPTALTVDSVGNVYVADTYNHTIRAITSSGVVTTLAGSPNVSGTADGAGSVARFRFPAGIVIDTSGNIYVADSSNHTIRRVQANGNVITFAGSAGNSGSANANGLAARFQFPNGLAVDSVGNVYVADSFNHTIRKVTPQADVTTLGGLAGSSGSADGNSSTARFNQPQGVAVDTSGNVFVADTYGHIIRKIATNGDVTTVAGSADVAGSVDGVGNAARFNQPFAIAVDSNSNVYIADTRNNTIRRSGTTSSPGIQTQPASRAAIVGGTATFTVVATGVPAPSYQWQRQQVGASSFSNLANDGVYSGVNTATLTINNVLTAYEGDQFRVVQNNGISPVAISNAATLTIGGAPAFTSAVSVTFRATEPGTFTVTATGNPTPTFSATGLPSWLSLNATTGVLSGTPPDSAVGTLSLTLIASNGGTVSQTFVLTIVSPVVAPTITAHPVSVSVNQGGDATFTVTAAGTPPITYQWRRNGQPIAGATSAIYTIANVRPSSAATFSVAVSNQLSTVISNGAGLIVNTPPAFASQPQTQTASSGSSVSFNVTVTGGADFSYQWRKNGTPIPGATNATLTFAVVTAADAGNFDVLVSNSLGAIGSSLAQLNVVTGTSAPVITAQPSSRTALLGSSALLAVGATGAPAPSYQWRKNGANISGANGPTLAFSAVQGGDAATYDVVVSSSAGSVTSLTASLRVINRSYAGYYFGTFSGGVGSFALYVRDDNTGVFLGYVPGNIAPVTSLNISVNDGGQFVFTQGAVTVAASANEGEPARAAALAAVVVSGTIATDGTISGAIQGGASASLSATRAPDSGQSQAVAGFYQAGSSTNSTTSYAIAGPNNQAFAITQSASASDGGLGAVSAAGQLSVVTGRSTITQIISAATGIVTGSSTGAVIASYSGGSDVALARQRLVNISSRARVGTADSVVIAGFVISGEQSKPVLIRAVGPTIAAAPFNVGGALVAPRLELFRGSTSLQVNSGIAGNRTAIDAAGQQSGAFALGTSGADAAILTTLAPGNYTAVVSSTTNTPGVALVEVYDLSASAPGQKLLNIATRAVAGVGDNTLIAGFVVPAGSAKKVLVRGVGPGLTPFVVAGVLAQPTLILLSGNTTVAQNVNWNTSADATAITAASAQVGAFGLANNDSAIIVTLAPGNYTAQILGAGGSTGVALIEVYELP
ncbi:MAG: hypothetical protein EXS37_04055 [Opitutus sp.]|nr:hypothetical protein [Opitutus sp.]